MQTGVAPGTIERLRVSVLRGVVRDRGNSPRVHVLDHPELGETKTRSDGNYDFAVNGGRALTLIFERDGSPVVHRQAQPVWRDWVVLDDVVLTPLDGAVSVVDFSSMPSLTSMRGSKVSDGDGARQATVLFAAGTTAMMRMPGGGTAPLGMAHLRATEFTVGDTGPNAMPAALPANSAYTYAVQLSADEAEQARATAVELAHSPPSPVISTSIPKRAGSSRWCSPRRRHRPALQLDLGTLPSKKVRTVRLKAR